MYCARMALERPSVEKRAMPLLVGHVNLPAATAAVEGWQPAQSQNSSGVMTWYLHTFFPEGGLGYLRDDVLSRHSPVSH